MESFLLVIYSDSKNKYNCGEIQSLLSVILCTKRISLCRISLSPTPIEICFPFLLEKISSKLYFPRVKIFTPINIKCHKKLVFLFHCRRILRVVQTCTEKIISYRCFQPSQHQFPFCSSTFLSPLLA